jgi:UDP-glucose 4-epimerase
MKFLITGGAGFIGSHIAQQLLEEKGGEVVVLDNLSVGKKENVPAGCRFVLGDIREKALLSEVLRGVDVVFHNAAFVSIRGSFEKLEEDLAVNCQGTLNVIAAACENKVKKIIFASSMAVYGEPQKVLVDENAALNPNSPYGLSKLKGEMYCRLFSEKIEIIPVVLRYFNTSGIRQTPSPYVGVITTFINQALQGRPLTIYGNGNQKRDFVWVKDVARCNVLAAAASFGGVFNVGSGRELSINQVADLILKQLGGEKVYVESPPGEIKNIRADIARAKKELNFCPQGDLAKLLPEMIEWWRKNIT